VLSKLRNLFKPADPPAPVQDAVLGTIEFNVEESLWEARVTSGGDALRICIAGKDAPDVQLLEHARAVAVNPQAFRSLISSFLNDEAPKFKGGEEKVRSLRLESLNLFWPNRPDDGMVFFDGGEQDRVWRCDYLNRQPVGLGFDS
jgi:hypothetical protein